MASGRIELQRHRTFKTTNSTNLLYVVAANYGLSPSGNNPIKMYRVIAVDSTYTKNGAWLFSFKVGTSPTKATLLENGLTVSATNANGTIALNGGTEPYMFYVDMLDE